MSIVEKYIDLLKHCLLDSLHGSLKEKTGKPPTRQQVEFGTYWPSRAHTMIGRKRLDNIQECVETILADNIPGDFIEAGVWRGGAVIFMRALLDVHDNKEKVVYAADSFTGFPKPTHPLDTSLTLFNDEFLAVSLEQVKSNFAKYGLLDNQVKFIEGYFSTSLKDCGVTQLSLLRTDCDSYEATSCALDQLYDKVSPGGFVIIDDYNITPCQIAIHDFRTKKNITEEIKQIDGSGIFWQKAKI